jgi:hypothetical protein
MSTRKTAAELRAELDAWEHQFRPAFIPPGTPYRRHLQQEANAAAHARACLPANIDYRVGMTTQIVAAMRHERAVAVARKRQAREATPQGQDRKRVMRALREMGFRRDHTSGLSAYYCLGRLTVRISDHEVPLTAERLDALDSGRRSWADSRWSFVPGNVDAEEWLESVREAINRL